MERHFCMTARMRACRVYISFVVLIAALLIPAGAGIAQGTPSASPSTARICPVTIPGPRVYNVGNYGNADLSVDLYPNGVIVFTSENGGLPGGPYSIKFP